MFFLLLDFPRIDNGTCTQENMNLGPILFTTSTQAPRIIPGHTGAQYLSTYGTGHTKGHTAILKSKTEDWKQIQNKETHFKKSKQESRIKNSENKKN